YGVEVGIGAAAAVVESDHVVERFQAAVVHVRAGQADAAQSRSLEFATVVVVFGDGEAAEVVLAPADSRVVELLVGEVGPAMAAPAAAFALVDPQAVPLGGLQRGVVALAAKAVDNAVAAQQYALEAGDGLAQVRRRHAVGKRFLELCLVLLVLLQALHDIGEL